MGFLSLRAREHTLPEIIRLSPLIVQRGQVPGQGRDVPQALQSAGNRVRASAFTVEVSRHNSRVGQGGYLWGSQNSWRNFSGK